MIVTTLSGLRVYYKGILPWLQKAAGSYCLQQGFEQDPQARPGQATELSPKENIKSGPIKVLLQNDAQL